MLLRDSNETTRRTKRHESREVACKLPALWEILVVIYRRGAETKTRRGEGEELHARVRHLVPHCEQPQKKTVDAANDFRILL